MKKGLLCILVVLCAVFLTAQGCQINQGQYNEDLLPTPDIECESITDEDDFCLDSTQRGFCDADGAYSTLEVCSTGYECLDVTHPSECIPLPTDVDSDGDGVFDGVDLCEDFDDALDADSDGTPDGCDLCVGHDDLADADGDGAPDGCDDDDDGDGVLDEDDVCPLVADPGQEDADSNNVGDACEDGDGIPEFTDPDGDEDPVPGGCVIGTVVDYFGVPREGAEVSGFGEPFVLTDASGDFCLETPLGGEDHLTIDYTIGSQTATEITGTPPPIPEGNSPCTGDQSACYNFNDITAHVMTGVSGFVLDQSGSPIHGAVVLSNIDGSVSTGSSGEFCTPFPLFEDINLYVQPAGDGEFVQHPFVPVSLSAGIGDPTCALGSSAPTILETYADYTCVTGLVLGSDGAPVSGETIEVFASSFSDHSIAYTTTNSNGVYCTHVPAATSNLGFGIGSGYYTNSGVETHTAGYQCDTASSYGECFDLGSVTLP
jgi:hypothetical protein